MTRVKTVGVCFAMLLGLAAALPLPGSAARAQTMSDTPTAPVLRIETGQHTAVINRLSADAAGQLVATASDDKTVRLWSLPGGRLEGTYRVPIGPESEGALYAAALSPDGKTLLAAGYTGVTWDGAFSLYLFDIDRKKIKARLTKLPDVVNHLAYSPDGKYFAAAFGGHNGLSVWSAADGKLVAEDRDYGDRSTWVAFAPDGRLATVSYDGFIRLYDPGFKLAAKQKAPSGQQPFSVAFSPNGASLAIGYVDSAKVDVLSARDLKPLLSTDAGSVKAGNFAAVGWTSKGSQTWLLAGGTVRDAGGAVIIRRWPDGGFGKAQDFPVARDSINQIAPLKDGAALYAGADPVWGVLNESGPGLKAGGATGDFRDIQAGRFGLSADGLEVDFGMAKGGTEPFRFTLAQGKLQRAPAGAALPGPVLTSSAVAVADWKNGRRPTVAGHPVQLDAEEFSRSLAFTPDGKKLLLGTDYSLRLLDGAGRELSKVSVPGAAWGVTVAGNGKLALAALGDGTLRWYSLDKDRLEELAAFFPHADGKRWIAWTREGFFAHAADGGKDLAGYHFNKGAKKTPEWVEFGQLYQLYYAPELVVKKLTGGYDAEIKARLDKIGEPSAYLNKKPLPLVELLEYCPLTPVARGFARDTPAAAPAQAASQGQAAPQQTASAEGCRPLSGPTATRAFGRAPAKPNQEPPAVSEMLPPGVSGVKLRYRVTDQGGGIGPVDVYLNGRNVGGQTATRGFGRAAPAAAPAAAGGAPAPAVMEQELTLDPTGNLIQVKVYEGSGGAAAKSDLVELTVNPQKAKDAAPVVEKKPRLFVLAAGIDAYKVKPLRFPVADAGSVADALEKGGKDLYSEIYVDRIFDDKVTQKSLAEKFTALAQKVEAQDTVVVYLAGHGVVNPNDDKYYYITQNVSAESFDTIKKEAFSQQMMEDAMIALSRKTKNTFLFLDTCHAGALDMSSFDKVNDILGLYLLAGSTKINKALDDYNGANGLFAHTVIQGLNVAKNYKGIVTNTSLGEYVQAELPAFAKEKQWEQAANFRRGGQGDLDAFPLVKVKN